MYIKNYADLEKLVDHNTRKTIAVVAAHDPHALEAVFIAAEKLPLDYILIGDRRKIIDAISDIGKPYHSDKIIDIPDNSEAAQKAVDLARDGKADIIMKGKIQTSILLKAVVNREHGIRKAPVMQHIGILQAPSLNKVLFVTDGGMLPHPTREQKDYMLGAMIDYMRKFGYEQPKIALLASSETVSEKMPETTDAVYLQNLAEEGKYGNAVVEGPMAFDVAISKKAAHAKEVVSKISGDVDGFLVPDIVSGNLMAKVLMYCAGGGMAGCIVGAGVPIVLPSRGASSEEKYTSILMCLISS